MRKYQIIYVDPPWDYNENWGNGCVKHHYKSIAIDKLKELPIYKIVDNNCHLYLWVTCPFIQEGLDLVKAWGFKYKQIITWIKIYKKGKIIMGLGYYFRVATEHCLFATRGKLPRLRKDLKNVMISPQLKHSEKPKEFKNVIIQHSGDLPRIELFAREKTEGWDVWGNEVESDIDLNIEEG